ncbi:MAG: hypothetical protein ABSG78_11115 [Verrucomicrobiota bacterium]|jgi:hypothetical protein
MDRLDSARRRVNMPDSGRNATDAFMKKLLALASAAGVLAAVTGCGVHISTSSGSWSDADLKAATNLSRTAEIPAGLKNLEVDNPIGAIRITGTENGPARWTWKLAVRARTEALAQQIALGVNCKTEMEGGRLTLVVSVPDSKEPHSIQSDFEISAPKSAAVRTQTHFGKTEIAGLGANVEAAAQNGAMEIHNIAGRVRARTSFDRMAVSDTGPATLQNQNGEIQAARIGGPLEAATSFALLRAEDIGGPATLANQNGEIKASAIRGLLDAKTSFASLVARDIGGRVHLRNQNGSVQVVQAGGNADIKTSFDKLSVEGIQGDAILVNQNGGVAASGVTGSVQATTSFAAMDIKGAGSEFVCHNQCGAIRLRATSTALTHIEASTSFDTLELHLPAGLKPALLARTSFGDIESDFPVLMKPRGADPFAEVAPGTLRASLQNQNGNIRVLGD